MNKLKVLLFCLPVLFLTGCWNYTELNDIAIVTGIAIDKDDSNFLVNYMISNANKSDSKSGSNQAGTVLYEGTGNTLSMATEMINQKLPRTPYLSHLEIIILSEEVAKTDILNVLDFLLRNPESRKEIFVLISKDCLAKDALTILTPLESFPSDNLKSNITASQLENATTTTIKYSEFLDRIIKTGIEPTLGVVEIDGNIDKGQSQESIEQTEQDAVVKLTSTAIFNDTQLVNISTIDESIAINIINNNIKNTYIESKCGDDFIVASLTSINTKTDVKVNNNIPKAEIKVEADGSLLEVNCKINLEDSKIIDTIKKQIEDDFAALLQKGITVAKTYQTDIFGLGNDFYQKKLKYWNTVKEQWNREIFPKLDVEIKTNIKLSSKGSLEQSIKEAKQ